MHISWKITKPEGILVVAAVDTEDNGETVTKNQAEADISGGLLWCFGFNFFPICTCHSFSLVQKSLSSHSALDKKNIKQ